MPTTSEEQADLDVMAKRLRVIYEGCIANCDAYDRMGAEELKHSGNRSKDEAIVRTVRATIRRKAELVAAHIKKWPDK